MVRRGFWFSTAVGAVLIMLVIALGLPAQGQAEDKIVIGVVNCLSGFGADMGQGGRQGATIAAEEINAAGGVKGKKIEFIYRDDETNPQKGVSAVNELLFKQGVKVIMGTNVTNVANAVNKIINDQKVLFVTIASGKLLVNPSEYPYTFRLNVSTDKEAIALVKHMVEKVKARKIGIIRDSTAFGQTGYASVMDALKPYKIEPVAVEIYNPGDTDMTSQLLKLKNAGAEQVIAWGMGPDLVPVTNSFARIGWFPYIASGIGATQISFFQLARKDVADKWVTTIQKAFTYPKGGKLEPEAQKFVDKLKAKYGLDNKAYIMNAGIWYDMIRLYALAVEKVGSQDPNAIKAFLEGTSKYDGLVSKYSFSKTNHDGFNIADMAVASTIRGDVFTRERVE
jgi:branched-chain amino acid transport system substrate-binding protein